MFNLLVVEDDRELNRAVCSFLNQNRYDALGCLSANEAYDALYGGTKECIDLAETLPNFSGTFIIDQDRSARDMLEDLRIGFENISRMVDG